MMFESEDEKLDNQPDKKEGENILDKPEDFEWAIGAINRLAKMEKYLSEDKLEADAAYFDMKKEIEDQAGKLAGYFFRNARSSEGKERLKYAQALEKLGDMVGEEKYKEILRGYMSSKETVEELSATGKREANEAKKKAVFGWIFGGK